MKSKIHFLLFGCIICSRLFSQDITPLSDQFIQKYNLTSADLARLQVYVKFVNSRIYKIPVTNPESVVINNKGINNLTAGVIIGNTFKPVSNCRIIVDFGDNRNVIFSHNAGDNEFYTMISGICLMLYTDITPFTKEPVKGDILKAELIQNLNLQELIDNAADNAKIDVPAGNYISKNAVRIKGRKNLQIVFDIGAEIFCDDSYNNVVEIENSSNIKIVNGHFRHIKITEGQCSGSVFYLIECNGIELENCDINGCGIIGVHGYDIQNVTVRNCFIHDNWYSAYKFGQNSKSIRLINNKLENNPNFDKEDLNSLRYMDIKEYE